MPIEIRELHIKSAVKERSAVVHVMFVPEGTPVRAKVNLPGKPSTYPDANAFASGLLTRGVVPGMKLEIVIDQPGPATAAGPPAPPVPIPFPGSGPTVPKPTAPGPVIFVPVPLPRSAIEREINALETAVRQRGYGNLTLKRGTF